MSIFSQKLKSLPSSPGVYIFYAKGVSASGGKNKAGDVLYVGKAGSLKDRVGSYFQGQFESANAVPAGRQVSESTNLRIASRPIEFAIGQIADMEIRKTDTVLEAYILEQELIKKLQPKYNAMGKDDKSFCYVVVTKEDFPRFVILRKTELENNPSAPSGHLPLERGGGSGVGKIYGPYTSQKTIEIALKILRKIFPYHAKPQKTEKGCLDSQIGLCPAPYDGVITKGEYAKNIRGIRMILEGKKKSLLNRMKKDMEAYSEKSEFEKAAQIRNKIFALQHIQDIALITSSTRYENFQFPISNFQIISKSKISKLKTFRIEGYDISNISGKYAVGSMVVFDNSCVETHCNASLQPNRGQYRKFKIKTIEGSNDVGAMEEVLRRRLRNNWLRPDLIILDGGAGHLNMARRILRNYKIEIPILAVAKGPERKKLDQRSFGTVPEIPKNIIEQVRDEAHRFAIAYHRKLRKKGFRK